MTNPIPVVEMPSAEHFVEQYIGPNRPVVIRGLDFDADRWTPEAIGRDLGDLTALIYGSLFDLEDVHTLDEYLEDWFGRGDDGPDPGGEDVPYVRWYNKLRDVEFAWGDDAFARVADRWRAPTCLPRDGYVVPVGSGVDPTVDHFPYRGLLVAARGARTRLHRDPFFSDAVVCMFHGVKDAVLYHPSRAGELSVPVPVPAGGGTSFGGFTDIRPLPLDPPTIEPDVRGTITAGDMLYVPHGWLHDVVVVEDSLSITWNFVHQAGAGDFETYLSGGPEGDTEFEILQYCHQIAGRPAPRRTTEPQLPLR